MRRKRGDIGSDQSAVRRGSDVDVFGSDEPGDGWLVFAGTVLGLAGLMRVIDAIWAFRYNGALPDNLKDGVLGSNLDNYGWTWLSSASSSSSRASCS